MSTDARLARWTAPLTTPSAEPCAHPAFDAIRNELAKLESPTAGHPDWSEVVRVGDSFLTEVGRDLVVGAALASALAHREGLSGIALGARLVTQLVSDASVAPPRPRARANALATFLARAELAFDESKDRPRAALEAIEIAATELGAAASALGDDAPSTRALMDRARAALAALPAPIAATPAPIFAPPPPVVPMASPSTESLPDRADQVPAFVRRVCAQLVPAASLLRGPSPVGADAIRLTLVALYLPITSAPDTTQGARTALPTPPKLMLETLAKQQASAETLVQGALAALERHRFALDLHAILARALDRTSPAAAAVHRHEVRGLCARLPELLDREFSDGSRFASADTRALFASWETTTVTTCELEEDPLAEMKSLAREGRIAEALAVGTRVRRHATSGRARFEATLAMALVAEDARSLALATELHAELLTEIDRHALDTWDPTLVVAAIRASVRVGTDPRAAFARVARIDARAAFEISSSLHATPGKTVR